MKTTALGFPGRLVKNTLLWKLVLVYSAIMLIPLLVTLYTITKNINVQMVELEIEKQDELTNKMSTYIENQYNKIHDIVFWLYNTNDHTQSTVDMLMESEKKDNAFLPHIVKNRITSDLNKIVLWDKEILDIILIGSDKQAYSTSKRSISVDYDFLNNGPLMQLDPSDKQMHKFPCDNLDYILYDNGPVISHVGNLYDLNNLLNNQAVGQYIINLSPREIMNSFLHSEGALGTSLYLLRDDGTILFSNEPGYTGKSYPFMDQVNNRNSHEAALDGETFILNKTELKEHGLSIIVQKPKKYITGKTNLLIRQILVIFFTGVIVMLILTLLFSTSIANKVQRLLTAMRQLEKGKFDAFVHNNSRDELGQLTTAFNRMRVRLKEHVDMVFHAELKTKSAELSSLQSRINPHFLLNTIESIRMKAVTEQSHEISHMLYTLGKLFHWKVRSSDLIITVEEELEYISSYLFLLQFRFQDQLDVKINVDEDIYEMGIPKLLLQPIIENASQHGLFHKAQQARLLIRGYREQHRIVFDIIDNGVGMDESKLHAIAAKLEQAGDSPNENHIGLSNVHQRIRILFGEPYGLTVTSKKDYWTRIKVTIPAMMKKEMSCLVPDFYRG